MEGPNLRNCPRTLFSCPVELRVGKKTIRLKQALGNLSNHGLFLHTEALPVGTPVHIKIAAVPPMEVDGIVRYSEPEGIHIEFTDLTETSRRCLDDLIVQFALQEPLPSSAGYKAFRKT
jgi:hypothetical protein